MLTKTQSTYHVLTLEQYAAVVLQREAPHIVGFPEDYEPWFEGDLLTGVCCTVDETHLYVIDTLSARLVRLEKRA